MTASNSSDSVSLCVDLDGTLVLTDLLYESLLCLLKTNILYLFLLPYWLFSGKANLKHQIAKRVDLDASLLPYNNELLSYLKEERVKSRSLTLATASNIKFARDINAHLGIFDTVLGSDENTNMSGQVKQQHLVQLYGSKKFDYAGNANVDFDIWASSREAVVVNADRGVETKARRLLKIAKVIDGPRSGLMLYLKAIRLHQWVKNVLIFIPLIVSHQMFNMQLVFQVAIAFLAFGLCASSVYLLNDLLDLPSDRLHKTKSQRPLASGSMPITHGLFLIPTLLLSSISISLLLPVEFRFALAIYYAITLAYSFRLKQWALIDVLVLAGLYTMRILAGAAAITIVPSFWLLAFSMFIFYSLALVKRYSELNDLEAPPKGRISGRGYRREDMEGLAQSGVASGFLAILVLALYINLAETASLYTRPEALWLLCPLLLYWVNRVWLLTRRGKIHDDPVVFAIFDRRSHWIALVGTVILIVAI